MLPKQNFLHGAVGRVALGMEWYDYIDGKALASVDLVHNLAGQLHGHDVVCLDALKVAPRVRAAQEVLILDVNVSVIIKSVLFLHNMCIIMLHVHVSVQTWLQFKD